MKYIFANLILLFLFAGVINNSYAAYPGECSKVLYSTYPPVPHCYQTISLANPSVTISADGNITVADMIYLHHDLCQEFVDAEIATWFYENGSWRLWDHDYGKFKIEYPIPGQLTSTTDSSHSWRYPPKDDCNDCNEEREQIIIQCGGEEFVDWSNWNQNSCSGSVCNPKINNNQGPPVCLTGQ